MSSIQGRLKKELNVKTTPNGEERKIIQLSDGAFQAKYAIGEKVMDSTHRHMEVKYATRRADGLKLVVKLRHKPDCFKCKRDETEWRISTEFMLNMPTCEGVAQLFEVCEDSKNFYIVTELASGVDLYELLHSHRFFTLESAREIMRQFLEGIAHMHENSMVHKDLKLENVVIDAGKARRVNAPGWSPQSVKIIDFDTVEEWTPDSPKAKDVMGTDQYIAQEAYDGIYSPCSDVFAAGVIFYRLLAGRFPFREEIFDDQPGENWVGSPKMKQIRSRLQNMQIDFTNPCFKKDEKLTELVERMLAFHENRRPTARDCLMSEFFGGPGLPKTPSAVKSPTSSKMPSKASTSSTMEPPSPARLSSVDQFRDQLGQLKISSVEQPQSPPKKAASFGVSSPLSKQSSIGSFGNSNNSIVTSVTNFFHSRGSSQERRKSDASISSDEQMKRAARKSHSTSFLSKFRGSSTERSEPTLPPVNGGKMAAAVGG